MIEPVAVIGMACRFPGATDPEALWELLAHGREAVGEIPETRRSAFERAFRDPRDAERVPWRRGGFLHGLESFDARFFGIAPREAERIDPHQRLLLETSWEAIEDACLPAEQLRGSATGVFMGTWTGDYERLMFESASGVDFYMTTGGGRSSAAGRLSHVLGLEGPSLALDTACSSSLVAVHLACQSLRSGECDLALAGGANVILEPSITMAYARSKMLSPDGRCKFGDASANGYVRSEGAGVVLLKPLARALADGDLVRAVIRASAVNHDGSTSGSIGRPAVAGQVAALRRAYRSAGIAPADVRYVEAHGTGTKAGDPVEVEALSTVLSAGREAEQPLLVGSVKTNLGHTEAASGIAGLVKVVLSLEKEAIPPSLHVSERNPAIDWHRLGVELVTRTVPWVRCDRIRIAGLNSFGISGTNAHVVLEEAPHVPVPTPAPALAPAVEGGQTWLLPLSARSKAGLDAAIGRYRDFLAGSTASMRDISISASLRRDHHAHRAAIVSRDRPEALEALEAPIRSPLLRKSSKPAPRVVFVFPGQGSQWIGMGRDLIAREPVFRARLEACQEAFRPYVDWSLMDQLAADVSESEARLDRIDVVQPTLFAVQCALAALWQHLGVHPDIVVGHSMGEVAAAYVAGALRIEDAARIICGRSRLLRATSGKGSMVLVELSIDEAKRAIAGCEAKVSVAVSNSARSTVLSGDTENLRAIVSDLEARDVFCRFVKVDVASHSPQMDGLAPELEELLVGIEPGKARVPMRSTVTGETIEGDELIGDYWVRNLRHPVLFGKVVGDLIEEGTDVFVEVSPHPILLPAIEQAPSFAPSQAVGVASMRRDEDERRILLEGLATLYVRGAEIRWNALYPDASRPVRLPTYPWQRERFWLELDRDRQRPRREGTLRTTDGDGSGLYYRTVWESCPRAPGSPEGDARRFVLFDDRAGLSPGLEARLRARGVETTRVPADADAEAIASHLDAASAEKHDVLELVYLGCVSPQGDDGECREASGVESFLEVLHKAGQGRASADSRTRLTVVTRGARDVVPGADRVGAECWPVVGLARVAAQEHPDLHAGCIDLGSAPAGTDMELDALAEELLSDRRDEDVALRDTARFVARLMPLRVREGAMPDLRRGAYLVTGGLGGLGLRVARFLAASGARRIGLMGRSAPSEAVARELDAIRTLGAELLVLRGDVTEAGDVETALAALRTATTPLRGVIHAAGVLEDGILLGLERASLSRVMAPKAEGARHLSRLTESDPLDFFVLFSSVVSLLGTSGQGSYAAANAYLDGLAHHRATHGRPALAVHWAPWAEVGLAARRGGSSYLDRRGIATLTPEQGIDALAALLGHRELTEVAVMPFHGDRWVATYPHQSHSSFLKHVLAAIDEVSESPSSEGATDAERFLRSFAEVDGSARRQLVESRARDEVSTVTRLRVSEIEPDEPFKSLGLDSLMGLELRNRLERSTGLRLSATVVWNYPTLEKLTAYLLEKLETRESSERTRSREASSSAGGPNEGGENEILELLEGVSELEGEQVEQMLSRDGGEKAAR